MYATQVMTYAEPQWGSRIKGTVIIRKDDRGQYTVDDVSVTQVQTRELFTVLTCVNGLTHYVFTAFFRIVGQAPITPEFS